MGLTISQTGYTITTSKFDTTVIENPFYETSSKRDTLIEQMKNNVLIVEVSEPVIDNNLDTTPRFVSHEP